VSAGILRIWKCPEVCGAESKTNGNHAMKIKRGFFIAAATMVLGGFFMGHSHAASNNIVERIGLADLDKLIKDKDCQCLIVAMAAWCGPCRKELKPLSKLYDKYKDRGLKVVGISLDLDGPEAMQRILEKAKVSFPVYWAGEEPVRKYNIFALPMLLFIKNGEEVERVVGKRSEKFLDRKIRDFLGLE